MGQLELNYMPIASEARSRDQQDLMAFPCFSLSKNKRTDIIQFEDGKGNYMKVSPHHEFGMATVWDFDIMLYFVSYIRHILDNGGKLSSSTFKVSGYDILKFCGRSTGLSQYKQLRKALQRLNSTIISTNIREDIVEDHSIERKEAYLSFTWVSTYKENTVTRIDKKTGKKKEIARSYEVQLPQWFVDGVANSKLVLGINPDYFQITGGLERWLYRTARKFAGINPNGVRYTLKHLHKRSGSKSPYRRFKHSIKRIIESGTVPDYHFGLYSKGGKEWLHISKKDEAPKGRDLDELMEELKEFELIAESPKA